MLTRGALSLLIMAVAVGAGPAHAQWWKESPKLPDIDIKPPKVVQDLGGKLSQGTKDLGGKLSQGTKDLGGKLSQEAKDARDKAVKEAKKLGGKIAAYTKQDIAKGIAWLKRTPLWKYMTARSLALFMESPQVIKVTTDDKGKAYTGDPVYYVNGMLTSRKDTLSDAHTLVGQVRRPVHVILNRSILDGNTGTPTCVDDISEAVYDKEWPANFATMNPAGIVPSLKTPNPPFAQLNPTTRQLTHLFYYASRPISIVSHSQGCIQVRNALLVASALGKESNIRSRVAWVACGTPVNDHEIWPIPAKYTYLINATDPVPAIIGVRGGPRMKDAILFKNPAHSTDHYFPRIRDNMLFGQPGTAAGIALKGAGTGKPGRPGSGAPPLKGPGPIVPHLDKRFRF